MAGYRVSTGYTLKMGRFKVGVVRTPRRDEYIVEI